MMYAALLSVWLRLCVGSAQSPVMEEVGHDGFLAIEQAGSRFVLVHHGTGERIVLDGPASLRTVDGRF